MQASLEDRYRALKADFEAAEQGHVFAFWDALSDAERAALLDDLGRIDAGRLPELRRRVLAGNHPHVVAQAFEPAEVIPREAVGAEEIERGRALLAAGRVAALTVAGGQGTRLGFDGPKGALPVSPVRQKPLFRLFAEAILATERRYGTELVWYVMTSPTNDAQTRAFFDRHACFGLDRRRVRFFRQGVLPAFGGDGRILLDRNHRVALAPDGHGGTLLALARTGELADMAARGIEQISYFQVDNPLVHCLDPAFIGLHAARGAEMSSKASPKADDLEHVGNFVMADGRLAVIEYSDLPDELAHARNPDGTRRFDAANLAIHILSRSFVERLTAEGSAFGLPWHLARKRVPFVDPQSGRRVEPAEPNATKLEAFIFDALPRAQAPTVLGVSRKEEFSPVKNATGIDSLETARHDLSGRAARWLEAAGVSIGRDAAGEPVGRFEISPLAALDAEELRQRLAEGALAARPVPADGGDWYLGD